MLKFKNIKLSIDKKELFQFPSLELKAGLVALVGRNGCGKSSFIKFILNEFENASGSVFVHSNPLQNYSKEELAKEIAVVYTKTELFGDFLVKDILALGRIPYQNRLGRTTEGDKRIIEKVAIDLEISSFMDRHFNSLSDGEKQLIMIARAFVQDTPIILMDEPTAFLDLVNRNLLIKQLQEQAVKNEKLILYSTHDIELLDNFCDAVLLIHNRELTELNPEKSYKEQISSAFNI